MNISESIDVMLYLIVILCVSLLIWTTSKLGESEREREKQRRREEAKISRGLHSEAAEDDKGVSNSPD